MRERSEIEVDLRAGHYEARQRVVADVGPLLQRLDEQTARADKAEAGIAEALALHKPGPMLDHYEFACICGYTEHRKSECLGCGYVLNDEGELDRGIKGRTCPTVAALTGDTANPPRGADLAEAEIERLRTERDEAGLRWGEHYNAEVAALTARAEAAEADVNDWKGWEARARGRADIAEAAFRRIEALFNQINDRNVDPYTEGKLDGLGIALAWLTGVVARPEPETQWIRHAPSGGTGRCPRCGINVAQPGRVGDFRPFQGQLPRTGDPAARGAPPVEQLRIRLLRVLPAGLAVSPREGAATRRRPWRGPMVRRAYPLQWYICDKGAPANVMVPSRIGAPLCWAISVHGLTCERAIGHLGRHAATGLKRCDGMRRVVEVWL